MKNFIQGFLIFAFFLMQGILVYAQEQPELVISVMHDKKITDVAYSPDGKLVATCSEDHTIKIWNTSDGKLIRNLLGHSDHVVSINFNSDGTKILTGSRDSTIIIWNTIDGNIHHKIKISEKSINSLCFSPDENAVLVSFSYYNISPQIWDIKKDSLIHKLKLPFHQITSAKYSPNGMSILTYFDGSYENENSNIAQIWNSKSGNLLCKLVGHDKQITSAKFTLDNKKIITASKDKSIKIWDAENGKLLNTFTHNNLSANNTFEFSPDGQKIIIASGKKSVLEIDISTETERLIEVKNKKDSEITKAFYSYDYEFILVVSSENRIIQFETKTGAELQTIEKTQEISLIEFSPNGEQMITCGHNALIYNVTTGKLLFNLDQYLDVQNPKDATISLSGNYLCQVFSSSSQIIDLKSGKLLHTLKNPEGVYGINQFTVEFSPNDSLLAIRVGPKEDKLIIWEVNSGQLLHSKIIHNHIRSFAFSKNSHLIITRSDDNSVNIWNAKSGILIHSLQHKDVRFGEFSPDSKYIITTSGDIIKIWSAETGKVLHSIEEKTINVSREKYFVPEIALFSPDGKYIIVGSFIIDTPNDRNSITILDANTYALVKTIEYEERNPCNNILFSPDSKKIIICTRIFIANSYQTIAECEIESGKLISKHSLKGGFLSCVDWSKNLYVVKRNSKIVFCNLSDDSEILSRITTKDESLSFDPKGHFDGDQSLFSKLYFVNKLETIPLDSYFEEFYTPNLWARTLNGDMIEKTVINLETQKPLPLIAFIHPPVGKIKFRGDSNASLKTDNIDYELEYSITDQGGGINEIRVFQNGKLIYNDFPKINQLDKSITHKLPIKLISGTNTLLITAFNDDRIEKSETAVIDFTGKEIEPSRLFMLCIGINEYQKSSYNLNFAVPDASSFLNAINTGSKDLFTEVILDSIKNKDATKANILSSIKKIQGNCKPNDVFIFYYAGHGVMNEDIGAKSSLYYIVPHEITNFYNKDMLKQSGISANEITEFSKNIKAQKQIFILDACQSGGALDQIASRGAVEEKAIAVLARSTGTYFLVASNSEQLASEFAALGHGVFTYSLLLGLTGQADSDQDKKISIKELSLFVESKVPELSEQFKGNAQYPASYGYGQDFPISLSDKYKMESKITIPTSRYSSYSLEELIQMKEEAIKSEEYLKAEELKIEIGKRK